MAGRRASYVTHCELLVFLDNTLFAALDKFLCESFMNLMSVFLSVNIVPVEQCASNSEPVDFNRPKGN